MQCELVVAADPAATAAELRALVPGAASVAGAVSEIIAAVRSRGDEAVLSYTRQLDTGGSEPKPLVDVRVVSIQEIPVAHDEVNHWVVIFLGILRVPAEK